VGHLPAYLRDRLGFLRRSAARYGDVVRLQIGVPTLLLASPDDIRHVLVARPDRYAKSPRVRGRDSRHALGSGLLTSRGAEHLQQRRILQPVFHRRMVQSFASTVVDVTAETTGNWVSGSTIDLSSQLRALTQRVMIETLLGQDGRDPELATAVTRRRRYYEHLLTATLPFPSRQPARARRQYPAAQASIDAVLARALATRRRPDASTVDLLAMLCALRHPDGSGMSDAQIRDEAMTFLDTGYETVAAAIGWACWLIAQHPECQRRLADEVREVAGARPLVGSDLPALRYTSQVISEALRLYPPTWMFVRVALEDDQLPSGAAVPAGTKLLLCPYIAQHDARHFADPEAFLPERFADGAAATRPRFSYFPFGGGPHTCIGEPFARMECALVLAAISQRFFITPEPGYRVQLHAATALRPAKGIRVQLAPQQVPA